MVQTEAIGLRLALRRARLQLPVGPKSEQEGTRSVRGKVGPRRWSNIDNPNVLQDFLIQRLAPPLAICSMLVGSGNLMSALNENVPPLRPKLVRPSEPEDYNGWLEISSADTTLRFRLSADDRLRVTSLAARKNGSVDFGAAERVLVIYIRIFGYSVGEL